MINYSGLPQNHKIKYCNYIMIRKFTRILAGAIAAAGSLCTNADIKGYVTQGEATAEDLLPGVQVMYLDKDSTVVASGVSDANGYFNLPCEAIAGNMLRFRLTGYLDTDITTTRAEKT